MRFPFELPHKRIAWAVFYILLAALLGFFFMRYLLAVVLPFLIAFITALALRRPSLRLSRGNAHRMKCIRVMMVVLLLTAALLVVTAAVIALVRQLKDLLASFSESESALISELGNMLDKASLFLSELPFFRHENMESMRETLLSLLSETLKSTAVNLAAKLPEWIAALVSAVPKLLLFFAVTVISAIYFCIDIEKILHFFKAHLGSKERRIAKLFFGECADAVGKYLRGYVILFLFTFSILFMGFVLLRSRFAFLIALLTAAIDVLPILGTGAVLGPWALWLFLTGETSRAVGLVTLYVVLTISRQIAEPKIMGAGMGLPPLVMLIATYAGLKLFGFWGMILLPPLAAVCKNSAAALLSARKELS